VESRAIAERSALRGIAQPDVIVAEITRLIEYLRGGTTPPFGITAIK
jgi:hypothetical protein